MRVVSTLGCSSCVATPLGLITMGPRGRNTLGRLGEASSGAAIIGVLVFAAIALSIVGRGKKARR